MKTRIFALFLLTLALVVSACGGGEETVAETAPPQQAATDAPDSSQPTEAAPQPDQFYLQITNVVGTVETRANANEAYAPAEVGQRLTEGAQIRTGADGIVALYRDAVTMVVVDNNSEAQIKTLGGTAEAPITIMTVLTGAVALDRHGAEMPAGAVLSVETPEGNTGQVLGSTVRVQYNPETKIMTATCLTGTCEFVRGDQKLTLEEGQAVDIEGLMPPPGAPEEMSVDQANQFLEMGYQLCGGCPITIGDIRDGGLSEASPAPDDLGSDEFEDGEDSSSDSGDSSDDSGDSNDGDSSGDSGDSDGEGGDSGDGGGEGGDSGDSGGDSGGGG